MRPGHRNSCRNNTSYYIVVDQNNRNCNFLFSSRIEYQKRAKRNSPLEDNNNNSNNKIEAHNVEVEQTASAENQIQVNPGQQQQQRLPQQPLHPQQHHQHRHIRTQFTGAPRVVRRPLIKTNSFCHYPSSKRLMFTPISALQQQQHDQQQQQQVHHHHHQPSSNLARLNLRRSASSVGDLLQAANARRNSG